MSRMKQISMAINAINEPAPAVLTDGFAVSIKTKGLFLLGALIVYAFIIAGFAFNQKNLLLADFDAIQTQLDTETMLAQVDVAVFQVVMAVVANTDASDHQAGAQRIDLHFQALQTRHAALKARLANNAPDLSDLRAASAALGRAPGPDNMRAMLVELGKVRTKVATLMAQAQRERNELSARYRQQSDQVAITTFVLTMMGLGLLGAIIFLSLRRLSEDLGELRRRALDIVSGYRGEPLAVTRHDEAGELMAAVNQMAGMLDLREKELMLERQKYFHQEKMAAIGTLAAGITHEIGNPIAAISGIAQEMVDRRAANGAGCQTGSCHNCRPEMISEQAQRLAAITREISEFASPRTAEPQLLDLNELVRSTSNLIRYDKRSRKVEVRLALDTQMPAIFGVADQLTQLIMNLMINAMDALAGIDQREHVITVATGADAEHAWLTVDDNGEGIAPDDLGRVFEAFFTTKPAGKGTGLGLSLCYAIVTRHGGAIDISSVLGQGTRVQVLLPLDETSYRESAHP